MLEVVARVRRRTVLRPVRVVAVVGSYGKTTTGRALAAVLATRDLDLWRTGVQADRLRSPHALLRARRHDRQVVVEAPVGRPGTMARRARTLRPDVVVVMSVGSEHKTFLPTLDVTRREKSEMVRVLRPDGLAVLNADDPNVRWMATRTRARVMTFGFGEGSDVRATDVELDWPRGTRFTLQLDGVSRLVSIRLIGRPMVAAALAALSVAVAEGLDLDVAIQRLGEVTPTPRRLQPAEHPSGAVILYDHYKSALETVDAALDALADVPARRKIVILGDLTEAPGSMEEVFATYDRLGARVAAIADQAIFVQYDVDAELPRYEPAALAAGLPANATRTVSTAPDAYAALPDDLRRGDVVLIKGANEQRFDRIRLALEGRDVRCRVQSCAAYQECPRCPMLERGWPGDPAFVTALMTP
jgi:UDP-N-acetylmuramoyl-tripeptide--D-alanyl-D-alanine ligase